MLSPYSRAFPAAAAPFAWSAFPGSGELIGLLDNARRALDHDPGRTRLYLERMAALFQAPEPATLSEGGLLPALPPHHGGAAVKGGLAAWQLKRVIEHIDGALDAPVAIESLAAVCKLSSGHFNRAFKVSVGETPHAFLIRRRIRHAQTLMLRTSDSLSQIACACGLTDQAHLTRLFRKLVGETPLAWRRARREPA
ncbi:MAG: helix-turn-helix transcriptional regulator [Sphingomonas sp.]|uniref:helix-turn-helix domain-containing protein n=1 Tax=Sphingomonas sp. TaxID=28214 RepID=UPI001AFEF77F|nr:AraC family transcriptional regulator [Sphingomonas sp.]MBO9621238.1 helix-turn-helix transcriptional regulator [Sphingomonas sp.]